MAIPDKVIEKTGEMAGQATQNAATLSQSPDAHWYDVWSQTGEGLMSHSTDPQYLATHMSPGIGVIDSRIRMAKAMTRSWERTDLDEIQAGMEQQASVIGEQASTLWNGETPEGKPLTTLQRVGAAFGLLTSIEQLVTMPLGMIPFPAFPALRIMDTDIGLPHAHMHPPNLTPPNPVPVPLPSTGPVIPIPLLSGASKTLINMMPAARCGDMGLGVFCGGFFPMYEVFLGSANVWIEGNRAGRVGVDITKHCIFSAPKPSDPPVGPMFGTTVSCSPNVMIGGVPVPSLTSMAIGAAFKAVFKGVGKVIGAVRKRVGKAKVRGEQTLHTDMGRKFDGDPTVKLTKEAQELLDRIPNPRDAVAVPSVKVSDLADMTRRTGDEFAVVIRDGELMVVRGNPGTGSVTIRDTDELLAHSHPHGPEHYPRDIGMLKTDPKDPHSPIVITENSDLARIKESKNPKPEAIIYNNGETRFYDEFGPGREVPGHSPISPDGVIDGKRH